MIRFSFLIAIYNGESYLARCLDSLLEQDIPLNEYEIICLDDCSPDNSSDVVRAYQQEYPNIRLYKNDHNCKIATNINRLIDWAQGKYFWTIGQDDIIETNCLGKIWNRLEEGPLDVLLFNYRRVNQNEQVITEFQVVEDTPKMPGVEWVRNQFSERGQDYCNYLLGYEWRAVYGTEYWRSHNIRCVDGLSWEDTVIMLKAISYSDAVSSISDILYNYRVNEGSISYCNNHNKRGDYVFEFSFQVGDEVEQFYNELIILAPDLSVNMLGQIQWRYNCFAFDLIRTSKGQKRNFYERYFQNRTLVKKKWHWLNWKSKLMLSPIGHPVSRICEGVYRIKKQVLK